MRTRGGGQERGQVRGVVKVDLHTGNCMQIGQSARCPLRQ